MNRAQKNAWFGLASFLFSDLLLGVYFIVMFIPHGAPLRIALGFCTPGVTLLVLGILLWRFRKRQSPLEPEQDERDRAIIHKAGVASFVSICALLIATATITAAIQGRDGTVPVTVLIVMQMGIFMAAMTIYFAAVVVQYRKQGGAT
ncbi:MAG: hypothetical protein LLF76_07795 [Planctomycetaceae bacterium]|nr:hypothetical protein [Planctomycetaceae bacterium]